MRGRAQTAASGGGGGHKTPLAVKNQGRMARALYASLLLSSLKRHLRHSASKRWCG